MHTYTRMRFSLTSRPASVYFNHFTMKYFGKLILPDYGNFKKKAGMEEEWISPVSK